jgi:hypothetical protein
VRRHPYTSFPRSSPSTRVQRMTISTGMPIYFVCSSLA